MVAPTFTRYGILGRVEVTTEAGPVHLTAAQRAIVAALVLGRHQVVPSDLLAEAVWGDRLPADPAAALRSQITRLRRALGARADELETADGGYRLVTDRAHIDHLRFEDDLAAANPAPDDVALRLLERTLTLWRGAALEEFADRPFAEPDATRLEELHLDAIEQRADRLLRLDRPAEATAPLRHHLVAHPERERGRQLLMTALYRTGRHTEALDVYATWRRHLRDELGVEPSPALRNLEVEILRHSVAGPRPGRPAEVEPAPTVDVPKPVSTFVGRHHELSAVDAAITGGRLVTLTGPGGVGKTRLALETVPLIGHRFPDGVVFCDLATVRRATDVAKAVATSIGVQEQARTHLVDQLVTHLSGRRALVVLDNCEHVLDGAADVAEQLTQRTRTVSVLATSRERLAADGEHAIVVPPLDVDGTDAGAIALFVQRSAAVGQPPPKTIAELEDIRELCRRLDGLPLALELAAARTGALGLTDLQAGLARRFALLDGGRRSRARHRSLRTVVQWSYDQLDPGERELFDCLSVVSSPFDVAAAGALVPPGVIVPDDVPALIARLVDRSLLSFRSERGATRYVLLETLRAYGLERLEERDELKGARARHASWVLEVVERAARGLAGPDEEQCVDELDRHLDEIRSAHHWLVGHDVDGALRLADALHPYAFWRARSEIFRWAQVSVAACDTSERLPAVLASVCAGAWLRGDLAAAEAALGAARTAARGVDPVSARRVVLQDAELALLGGRLDDALLLFRQACSLALRAGDLLEATWSLGSGALTLGYAGQREQAAAVATEAAGLATEAGSPSAVAFTEFVFGELSAPADPATAMSHLDAAIQLAESVGNRFIAGLAQVTRGSVAARTADVRAAISVYLGVILTWQGTGVWISQWITLRNVAELLTTIGAEREAAILYGAIAHTTWGPPAFGRDLALLEETSRRLQRALEPGELRRLIERGRRLRQDEVVDVAISALTAAQDR